MRLGLAFAWIALSASNQAASAPRALEDSFELLVVATLDPSPDDPWVYSYDPPPNLVFTEEAMTWQPVRLLVHFSGAEADDEGLGRVTYDVVGTQPDGSKWHVVEAIEAWNQPVEPIQSIRRANEDLTLRFEPDEPLGVYELRFTAQDRVGEVIAEQTIELEHIEPEMRDYAENAASREEWIQGYHRAKPAAELLSALLDVVDVLGSEPQLATFFAAALDEARWLIPVWSRSLEELSRAEQRAVISVIASLPNLGNIEDDELGKRIEASDPASPVYSEEDLSVADPGGLDHNWSVFFATGSYDSIRRICRAMEWDLDAAPEDDAELNQMLVTGAAIWSLSANARNHGLVLGYLRTLSESEELSNRVQENLRTVMKDL